MLGEIDEVCDDGNTVDGDGCSADCQTVDVDQLCIRATALTLGAPTMGDTTGGRDGLMSSCQALSARAQLYEVTPPGPGRLRLHLTSPTTQTLSARSTCADAASELGCKNDFSGPTDEELIVQITDATPAPLTVMVSASNVLEQGPFTVTAEFTPEQCGDGIIAGHEVCDDANTTANDGCSADCRTIEYDFFCAQAPTLSTSATNAGTLDGAATLFEASCAADAGATIHPTQLYTYVAPAAGNLHLQLVDGTGLSVLAVRDGCDTPAASPELACAPGFVGGEIDVAVTAGQSITVAVVSFLSDINIGTFTVDAAFTPR